MKGLTMTHSLGSWKKTVTVTIIDGDGMPKDITVVVPANATEEQIADAIDKKMHSE